MSTAYRPLPVVTRRPKTRCRECMHEFSWPGESRLRRHAMCGLVFGFDLFRDADCPPGLPSREQADAGLCDYFKPTLRTRLAWWLGLRERETLTLVDGEDVSTPDPVDSPVRVEIRMSHEVAAYCEFGSQPPGVPPLRYIRD